MHAATLAKRERLVKRFPYPHVYNMDAATRHRKATIWRTSRLALDPALGGVGLHQMASITASMKASTSARLVPAFGSALACAARLVSLVRT